MKKNFNNQIYSIKYLASASLFFFSISTFAANKAYSNKVAAVNSAATPSVSTTSVSTTVDNSSSNGSSVVKSTEIKTAKPQKNPFKFSWEGMRYTSLVDHHDGERKDGFLHQALFSYNFYKSMEIVAASDYNQDFNKSEETGIQSLIFFVTKMTEWKGSLGSLYPVVRLQPAASKTELDVKKMNLATGVGLVYTTPGLFDNILTVQYKPAFLRYFYESETDVNKKPLKQYEFRQFLIPTATLGSWSFQMQFVQFEQWTFDGRPTTGVFEYSQELAYAFNDNFSVGLNHTNSGQIYSDEGGMNTRLVDDRESLIGFKLGLSF